MATKQSKPSTHNRKVSDLLRFLDSFQVALRNFNECAPTMLHDLQKHIEALPLPQQVLSETDKDYLHEQGTHLWNSCTKLRWGDPSHEDMRMLCRARAFSYLVLDSKPETTQTGWTKMMRLCLKSIKDCLDLKETELAMRLVERSTTIERSLLTANAGDSPSGEQNLDRLAFEHAILKLLVYWQLNRTDLMEQTLKALLAKGPISQDLPMRDLAGILCEVGRDAYQHGQSKIAIYWLDRAMNIITDCGSGDASEDLGRLKLDTLQLLARIHMAADGDEGRPKAVEILRILTIEHAEEPTTLLLRLKLLRIEGADLQSFNEVLSNTISCISLTGQILNIILQRINLLKDHDPSVACKIVDQLVRRLVQLGEDEWVEKTLVTRFWMSTIVPDRLLGVSDISELLTDISIAWAKTLTAKATYAILVLLWKSVESDFNKGDFSTAASWCRLSQHTILQRMGESDQAKFERKVIDCSLQTKAVQVARDTFASMSKKGKSNASTQYLMYKVALVDGDEELGLQCFENLCRTDNGLDANKYMFGCIFEAQQSDNKHQAALILEKLLEKHDHGAPRDIHVPALLRCAVRLLVSELDNDRPETIESICRIFKREGAHQARKSKGLDDARTFSLNELEWFSRNSYNLALQQCTVWPSSLVLRVLESCSEFMELYPSGTPTALFNDLALRRIFCSFLSCALHVTQARLTTNTAENQLQNHLLVRKHAQSFYSLIPIQLARSNAAAKADLVKKYRSVLLFDFEAATQLKAWEALREILDQGEGVANERGYGIFADIVLASEALLATKGFLLMRILNSIRQQTSFKNPTANLSRHLRCVFQLALESDLTVAWTLLDQAIVLAREGAVTIRSTTSGDSSRYPPEEAEWLAAIAFNTAIDFYADEDDVEARGWGEKAIEMASFAEDNGILVGMLKGRFESLDWRRA